MAETSFALFLDYSEPVLVDSTAPNGRKNVVSPDNSWELVQNNTTGVGSALYLTFDKAGTDVSSYLYKKLTYVEVFLGGVSTTTFVGSTYLSLGLSSAYDKDTITWNNRPSTSRICILNKATRYVDGYKYYCQPTWDTTVTELTDAQKSSIAKQVYDSPAVTFLLCGNEAQMSQTHIDTYLSFHVNTSVSITSKVTASNKSFGYVNPTISQTFSWKFVPNNIYSCLGDWSQTSATFYWSSDNGSTWNSVAASGSTQSVTLAANTLPSGTILWKVTATDDQSTTTTSDVYTITTEDALQVATPVSPISTIEDSESNIVFEWSTSSDTSTTPTGADIQISSDGSTWSTLGTVSGSATTYTASGGTIAGGTVYWRVRAYNTDNVAGSWSNAVSFVAVGAPAAPVVTCDGKPFATVNWQSVGQEAWEVVVDSKKYGAYFGSAKTFVLPDYLEDGSHTVKVRVQGSFGLWSQYGQTTFTVINVPANTITLSGTFFRDAELSWETDDAETDFRIYRDDILIGKTSYVTFSDRTTLGFHNWKVVNKLSTNYYSISNVLSGELSVFGLAVATLDGGQWLELPKSIIQTREENTTFMQTATARHFVGSEYPEIEVSPYVSKRITFSVAWNPSESEEAQKFESMIGKAVIFKNNEVFVGMMTAYNRSTREFYRAYDVTIEQINWKGVIDENS